MIFKKKRELSYGFALVNFYRIKNRGTKEIHRTKYRGIVRNHLPFANFVRWNKEGIYEVIDKQGVVVKVICVISVGKRFDKGYKTVSEWKYRDWLKKEEERELREEKERVDFEF